MEYIMTMLMNLNPQYIPISMDGKDRAITKEAFCYRKTAFASFDNQVLMELNF